MSSTVQDNQQLIKQIKLNNMVNQNGVCTAATCFAGSPY